MQTTLAQMCQTKPWRLIEDAALGHAVSVPTMLNREEQKFYHWLAKTCGGMAGHIVDLGSFVGGSTAALASGADRCVTLHAFDRFTAKEQTKQNQLYVQGVDPFEGNDILPLARRLLSPYAPNIRFYKGNVGDQIWGGEQIDVLTLDASKEPRTMDGMAAMFFPHLIAGHSVIVQQDFLHWRQPWIPAQMAMMQDFFTPLAMVAPDSVSFQCTKVPTLNDCKRLAIDPLSDDQIIALVEQAKTLFHPFAPPARLDRSIAAMRANPGVRVSWQLKN